jgi:hypothetical protein
VALSEPASLWGGQRGSCGHNPRQSGAWARSA